MVRLLSEVTSPKSAKHQPLPKYIDPIHYHFPSIYDFSRFSHIHHPMEFSLVLGNGYHPVFHFHSTRPFKNSGHIATPPPPTQLRRVTTPVSSSASATHTEVRSKSTNVSKNIAAWHKTKESAIHDIQHSSDLESALLRFWLIFLCFFNVLAIEYIAVHYHIVSTQLLF